MQHLDDVLSVSICQSQGKPHAALIPQIVRTFSISCCNVLTPIKLVEIRGCGFCAGAESAECLHHFDSSSVVHACCSNNDIAAILHPASSDQPLVGLCILLHTRISGRPRKLI